ncbi:MAG TPA: hypothetical protein VFA99_03745 [Acidobacteriaceae bacterium]|nr:hypothetical protein [Acidobacteriaceae bacterium]
MIDIHPPQHGSMTRRDILTHLAIVVLGILIAIGLEQAAEVVHHHRQRRQLEADLRAEAQRNVDTIQADENNFATYMVWYRDVLKAGREAKAGEGFVTFVIPPKPTPAYAQRPMDNVWPAATASGTVAVLPREEIEVFGRISTYAQTAEKASDIRQTGDVAENAVLSRLGLTLDPSTTVRVTPQDRDELMRAIATHLGGYRQLAIADAAWQGASEAVLHGARSIDDFSPYIARAQAARPK